MVNSNLAKKLGKIKIMLTDVDGVLTDGGRYYYEKDEVLKKFHVRDGMGVNILLRNEIKTIIITKENSKIVKYWAKAMNVSKVYSGVKIKEKKLKTICKTYNVMPAEIAFIGDDVNDIELMKKVGLSATPFDASSQTLKIAKYICRISGGSGAFREFADMILEKKFQSKTKWY